MRPPKSHVVREVTLVAFCGLAAACSDHNLPSAPESPEPSPFTSELVSCQVDVRTRTLSCARASAASTGADTAKLSADVILGGQGTYVQLRSTNVSYDPGTQIFRADVTVQNLTALTLGTPDGSMVTGVKVFFHSGPSVVSGTGAVTVANADGTETFTGTNQAYFLYRQILPMDQVSTAKTWQWNVPSTVVSFKFFVLVAAATPPGSGMIGNAGGTVALPGGPTITVPSGAITGHVAFQLAESTDVAPHYTALASTGYNLAISVGDPATTFTEGESLHIAVPISQVPPPGTVPYLRAVLQSLPGEDFWAPAEFNATTNQLLSAVPASGLGQLGQTPLGSNVRVLLVPEAFAPAGPAGAAAPARARLASGPDVGCVPLPSGAPALAIPCDETRLRQVSGSKAPGSGDVAIVLVHGWSWDVGNPPDFYRAEGVGTSHAATLPGEVYFEKLLTRLVNRFGAAYPIYVFSYQSYRSFYETGDSLLAHVQQEQAVQHFSGVIFVTHSMGGLVARAATAFLNASNPGLVRGIVTLATPHEGTPYPVAGVFLGRFIRGVVTPGGQSLVSPNLSATEQVPLLSYAGDLSGRTAIPSPYGVLYWLFCHKIVGGDKCPADGVVTVQSALPGFIRLDHRRVPYGYTHSEMHAGFGSLGSATDPLYVSLFNDIQNLAASLSATLTANPASGMPPLATVLSAAPQGTATGTLNYTFWWNCADVSTSVSTVSASCGDPTNPAIGAKFVGVTANPQTVGHTYATAGTYTAKVIVERTGAAPAQQRVTVRVGVALADTVSGNIATPGQIDQFTFSGAQGQEVAVFLQTFTGSFGPCLVLDLLDQAGTLNETRLGNRVTSCGSPSTLTGDGRSTGRVVLPGTGTYTVRVQGSTSAAVGPYRFLVFGIDRAPEGANAVIAPGDTVQGEALDPAGDVDEYTFSGTAGQEIAVFLQTFTGSFGPCLVLDLLDQAGTLNENRLGNRVTSCGSPGTLTGDGRSTGRVALPRTASYAVRVQGIESSSAHGPYRLWLYPVNRAPESVNAVIVPGETVQGEALDPPGDVDEYTFAGTAGQEVAVFLQTFTGSFGPCLVLDLLDQAGTLSETQLGNRITSCGSPSTLTGDGRSTGRVMLPRTATYTVRVQGIDRDHAQGLYRVLLYPVNRAPESVNPVITLGDTVQGESLDQPGDMDEFRFLGVRGHEVAVFLQTFTGSFGPCLVLDLVDQAGTLSETRLGNRVTSCGTPSTLTGDGRGTGRVVLPRTASYTVRVQGIESSSAHGSYRLWLYPVNRAPEGVTAAIQVGDTVPEAIEPPGDVDEFTFTGTQGQQVAAFLQTFTGSFGPCVQLDVLSQAGTLNETRLGNRVQSCGSPGTLDGQTSGTVTLPSTATYAVRVQGTDSNQSHGAYRLNVRQIAPGSVAARTGP